MIFNNKKMSDKNTSFTSNNKRQIRCRDQIFSFEKPLIMGILNVTPDSFYDGGKYKNDKRLLTAVEKMIKEGADIIDIGGMSTRPGAKTIDETEELKRVTNALSAINKIFTGLILSVDTYRAKVATASVDNGANIINDISGGNFDKNMFKTIAKLKVPYVLMHINGNPETMQKKPLTKNILKTVKNYFEEKIKTLNKLNVFDIIIDPGFGFGKSLECNYKLLSNLHQLNINNLPILAGISRKSMINKVLNTTPSEALNGTTALNMTALLNGADILRVHDVKEAVETVKLFMFYKNNDCN
jgi:dihydropteroate synthase